MAQLFQNLIIDAPKCTGCKMCELACSLKKEGEFNPGKARMRAVSLPHIPFYSVVACLQCTEPACAAVCPTAALAKDRANGLVRLFPQRCVGCLLCLAACPFGGIFFSAETGKVFKCDHCEGDPQCVAVCAPGCLSYAAQGPSYRSLAS